MTLTDNRPSKEQSAGCGGCKTWPGCGRLESGCPCWGQQDVSWPGSMSPAPARIHRACGCQAATANSMWRRASRLLRRGALLRHPVQRTQHEVVRWQEQLLAEHGCRGCSMAALRRHSSAACFAAQVQEVAVEPATASYDAQQIQARLLTALLPA